MNDLKEIAIGIARAVLGVLILIGGLIVVDLIVYVGAIGSTFNENISAAYDESYSEGYVQTYEGAYQEAYGEAHDKGYNKGYEIRLWSGFKEGVVTRVELINPTYVELIDFLASDKTDLKPYIMGEYVCFDFAAELNNNAEANGIRAAYVRIRGKDWGHAVVAFETVDRGLILIEPQTDREVEELVIGKPYPWWSAGAVRITDYDNVIVKIQAIW